MGMKKGLKIFLLLCSLCLTVCGPARTVSATETVSGKEDAGQTGKRKQKKKQPEGVWKEKKQNYYYYPAKGKRLTGLQEIKGKTYYFDQKGVQRTGWQKIKGDYYFFTIANGKKGSMVTDQKVNGVYLRKGGKAKVTADSKSKLDVMVKANQFVERYTRPGMKKPEKLRRAFTYSIKKFSYCSSPEYGRNSGWKGHWERKYALEMFDKGGGDCYAYGASFAFLANACGYKDCYAISSGGHGWAEVDGEVYDPSWAIVDKRHNYFGMSYSLSGRGGRPRYKTNRLYVVKI